MARDIEEFLRKAAERRKQQGAAPPAAAPSPPEAAPPRPAASPPARPKTPRPQPVEAEVVRPQRLGAGVAQHVRQHINTKQIAEHVSHLGEEVAEADDKLEKRLHERFDAGMGSLAGDRKTAAPAASSTSVRTQSADLIELLRNPRTLRQAILISEILKRPEY